MSTVQPLMDQVQRVDAGKIVLPILSELVRDIQTKTPDQIREENRHWTDDKWRQWKQHSSHNPW